MIVTFQPSPHYDEILYCNEYTEKIVDSLAQMQQENLLIFLIQGILDLNVSDEKSWLKDCKSAINARGYSKNPVLKHVITWLYTLKKTSGQKSEHYLSAIVPKYVLLRLEQRFQVNGALDVFVCIQKKKNYREYEWKSQERKGSNSVDVAIWNNSLQSGACYECKLATTIKQDQVDLLCCINNESDRKIEVGIASFASSAAMKKALLCFNIPPFIKIITRDNGFWLGNF